MPSESIESESSRKDTSGRPERLAVVNADDLGLHTSINEGIRKAHTDGIVTSASLVACGTAFDEAVEVCRSCPSLGIGVHLTVVEERPLCPPGQVASLVDADGRFPRSYRALTLRTAAGLVRRADLEAEFDAQVRRVLDHGIRPTHIDSHQHVHLLPPAWPIVLDLARRYGIPFVRVPQFDSLLSGRRGVGEVAARAGFNVLSGIRRNGLSDLKSPSRTPVAHLSGHVGKDDLIRVFESLGDGVTEIGVHPGACDEELQAAYPDWGFEWEGELAALTSPEVRRAAETRAVRLVTYGDVRDGS